MMRARKEKTHKTQCNKDKLNHLCYHYARLKQKDLTCHSSRNNFSSRGDSSARPCAFPETEDTFIRNLETFPPNFCSFSLQWILIYLRCSPFFPRWVSQNVDEVSYVLFFNPKIETDPFPARSCVSTIDTQMEGKWTIWLDNYSTGYIGRHLIYSDKHGIYECTQFKLPSVERQLEELLEPAAVSCILL